MTLKDLLQDQLSQHPDKMAFTFEGDHDGSAETATYRQLDVRAQAIACWLDEHCDPRDRVLLVYPPGIEFIAALMGCIYARVTGVPVCPIARRGDESRMELIARDCGAHIFLTSSALMSEMRKFADLEISQRQVEVFATDSAGPWRQQGSKSGLASPDDIAYLQYTSGTTANPRGVVLTHDNVLSNLKYIDSDFEHDGDTVSVSWLPHFHDMGLVYGIFQPIFNGFPCYLMSPRTLIQNPLRWLQTISRYRATHSGGPNFAYDLCVRRASRALDPELDLSSWRVAFTGAEPVRAETLQSFGIAFGECGFRRSAFFPAYGLAEATLKVTSRRPGKPLIVTRFATSSLETGIAESSTDNDERGRELVSCGYCSGDTRVQIIGDNDRPLNIEGEIGEVWVSGPGVAQGYWENPTATKDTFGLSPRGFSKTDFLRTGDLGFVLNGELFITGRLKDLIILRGQNYYPQDIEATSSKYSGDHTNYSASAFQCELGSVSKIVLVQEVRGAPEDELLALAQHLATAVMTEHGIRIDELFLVKRGTIPKTSSGKLQRDRCRRIYQRDELKEYMRWLAPALDFSADSAVPPNSDARYQLTEDYCRRQVAALTGRHVDEIDPSLSLPALGLDSLAIAELQSRIERDCGCSVAVWDMVRDRSLGALVASIRAYSCEIQRGPQPDSTGDDGYSVKEGRLPLADHQVRFLLLHKVHPSSSAHNISVALQLGGNVDVSLLSKAISLLRLRHPNLRVHIEEQHGSYYFVDAGRESPLPFSVIDVSASQDPDTWARSCCNSLQSLAFGLFNESAFRAVLITISPTSRLLVLTCHHVVSDAWSMKLLLEELGGLYSTLRRTSTVEQLPSVRTAPSNFGRQTRSGHAKTADIEYWSRALENAPVLLLTSEERRRDIVWKASTLPWVMDRGVVDQLRDLAKRQGATLFVLLLSLYIQTLHRVSKQPDFIVGLAMGGREKDVDRHRIGCFSYALPIRIQTGDNTSFTDLVANVRDTMLEACTHDSVSLTRIYSTARIQRAVGVPFGIQAMFGLVTSPRLQFDGLSVQLQDIHDQETEFDVFLTLRESEGALSGTLTYNREALSTVKAIGIWQTFANEAALVIELTSPPEQFSTQQAMAQGA